MKTSELSIGDEVFVRLPYDGGAGWAEVQGGSSRPRNGDGVVAKTKVPPANGKTEIKIHAPRKLDIACGQNKQVGFKGIDIAGDADIIWDLFQTPWPIKTSCVQEAFCSHFVEHLPHYRPEFQGRDGWWVFFDELYRVMRNEGTVEIIHPYVRSDRAFWDPTHTRYIHEATWSYLDRGWREMQGLDHYAVSCDFEIVTITGLMVPDSIQARNQEQQMFARTHYWNPLADLGVLLKARK